MTRFFVILLLASTWVIAQETQKSKSLAELAKKTRETQSQSSSGKQVRVITNKDLKKLDSNVSSSSSARSALKSGPVSEGQEGREAQDQPQPGVSSDEVEDLRKEFEEARRNLEMAVNEGLVLQLRMNNLRNAWQNRSDGATQERVFALMAETNKQIEENKQAQQEARDEIRQLQRKAASVGLTSKEITKMTGTLPENSAKVDAPEIQQE